jgi:F0F1-type ATP synthase assembly protein I
MPDDPEPSEEETTEERFRKLRSELESMRLPDLSNESEPDNSSDPLHVELPPVPEVHELTSSAWKSKEKYDAQKRETEKRQRGEQDSARGAGVGLSIAYTIIGVPMFFILVGWFMDAKLKTETYRGLGALIGSVLGIVVAIAQINRNNQRK